MEFAGKDQDVPEQTTHEVRLTEPPAATWLYLVRHGATQANERKPYILQGCGIDLPLSETGRRQAQALSTFLAQFPIAHIYASRLERALETARAVAAAHALEVVILQGIQECHVGRWESMDWDSIMREFPEAYRAFVENPADTPYLGGESYADVLRRARAAIDSLWERHAGESIVVVAHNVVNRAYLAHLLGLDLRKAKDLRQSNTGVNVIRHRAGATELVTLNAEFHLRELSSHPDVARPVQP